MSSVTVIQNNNAFSGKLDIKHKDDVYTINSNNMPNHNFNDESAKFVTPAIEIRQTFVIPIKPKLAGSPSSLRLLIIYQ